MAKFKPVFITLGMYAFAALFIAYSINQKTVNVAIKEERDVDEKLETHPVKTYLIINNGFTETEYYARLEDSDSLSYLFDYHRENSELTYEKTRYIYGAAIDSINGYKALDGYVWKVYNDGEDITFNIDGVDLENNHVYLLKLEQE